MGYPNAIEYPPSHLAVEPDAAEEDGFSETAFAVDGMFCGGCASTVERALKRLPGFRIVSQ